MATTVPLEPTPRRSTGSTPTPSRRASPRERPARVHRRGRARLARHLDARGAYTYVPGAGTIDIVAGDEAADTVIATDLESWVGLASDLDTAPGLSTAVGSTTVRGKPLRFVRWETGAAGDVPRPPRVRSRHGRLRRPRTASTSTCPPFTLADIDEQPDAARHFLDTAGYLLVRGVFTPDEVAALLADAVVMHAEARPGDSRSWWGRNASGEEVLCRVLDANRFARASARCHDDPRVRRLVALAPEDLRARDLDAARRRHRAVEGPRRQGGARRPAVAPRLRHGRPRAQLPRLIVTICLTDGTAGAGELRALPGSQHVRHPFIDGTRRQGAPHGVSLTVTAGDVSLHYTDVMHASLPPTSADGPHRISALLGFVPPRAGHHRGERHYNDVLLGQPDGQVEHLVDRLGG